MNKNKISFALFFARSEWESWSCLQAHPQFDYEVKKSYASWEIPALMRLLLSNQSTLNNKLTKELIKPEKQDICLLIKWETNLRLIAIIDYQSVKKEQLEELSSQREILYQQALQLMDMSRL
jgi:hypothetical protein